MLERLYAWYMTDEKKPLPNEFQMYKALLYDDGGSRRRVDVTETIRSGAQPTPPADWSDEWHVEVRYVQRGAKYRVLFPRDRPVVLPVYSSDELASTKATPLRGGGLLSAFVGRENAAQGIDVTDHVTKYCGPKGNWYRDKGFDPPPVAHMFMNDDPRTVRQVYPSLHVRTLRGVRSFPILNMRE